MSTSQYAVENDRSRRHLGQDARLEFSPDSVEWLAVGELSNSHSPRLQGENADHIDLLAKTDADLPPIIVHRASLRVIDGMHRLAAARLRGEEKIKVQYFDGTDDEAFVLAVQANVTHGLPLSVKDRSSAAERIIASHPVWSDRSIAAATGLGARTVAGIRRRLEAQGDMEPGGEARVGRDGRVRPLNNEQGRLRASELLRDRPTASLREIAKLAGVSPSTAWDVRNRLQRGDDPLPGSRAQGRPELEIAGLQGSERADLAAALSGLTRDPSLRFTENGRTLLRWVLSHVVRQEEWRDVAENVPPHCSYIMADVARRCANEWLELAHVLDARTAHTG